MKKLLVALLLCWCSVAIAADVTVHKLGSVVSGAKNVTIIAEDNSTTLTFDNVNVEFESTDGTQRTFKITSNKAGNTTVTLYENFTIGDGFDGTLTFTASGKTLSVGADSTIDQNISSGSTVQFAGISTDIATFTQVAFTTVIGDPAFDGTPTIGISIDPDTADGAALGSSTKEWSDAYFASGAVIYFQNDQSVTLTADTNGLTVNKNISAATYGSDGSIPDATLLYINTLSSNAQTQLNLKAPLAGPTFTGSVRMTLVAGAPFIAGGTDIATLTGVSISNANPSVLTKDATIDDGLAVNDAVIVNSGTNATVGSYIVKSIVANTSVTLDRQAATGVCDDGNITYVNDPSLMVTPTTVFTRQIAFPATAVPSADPNTLDDYEQGAFTFVGTLVVPGDSSNAGQTGTYTKIGDTVILDGTVAFTKGTGTGYFTVTGLPFAANSTAGRHVAVHVFVDAMGNAAEYVNGLIEAGQTQVSFYMMPQTTASATNAQDTDLGATATVRITAIYKI